MSAGVQPIFVATPKQAISRIAAANTARDGSGTLVTSNCVGGSNGARVEFITFTSATSAVGTPSAKVCRVFVSDTSGANFRLRSEIVLAASASSNSAIGTTATITFVNGLMLEPGMLVSVSQSVYASAVDQTDCFIQYGNY